MLIYCKASFAYTSHPDTIKFQCSPLEKNRLPRAIVTIKWTCTMPAKALAPSLSERSNNVPNFMYYIARNNRFHPVLCSCKTDGTAPEPARALFLVPHDTHAYIQTGVLKRIPTNTASDTNTVSPAAFRGGLAWQKYSSFLLRKVHAGSSAKKAVFFWDTREETCPHVSAFETKPLI